MLRGGSFYDVNPDRLRCAFRRCCHTDYSNDDFGFRVAMPLAD